MLRFQLRSHLLFCSHANYSQVFICFPNERLLSSSIPLQDNLPVTESVQPPMNDREVKKKKQRKKNSDRSVDQDDFDTSPLGSAASLPVPDNGSSFAPGDAR